MRRRRFAPFVAATVLVTAACGSGSDSADPTDTASAPSTDAAPAADDVVESTTPAAPDADADPADSSIEEAAPAPTEPAVDDSGEEASMDGDEIAAEAEADEPPAEEAPPAIAPAELGGRAFAESVEPASQFDGDPFPDLVVDDVGRETKANLANILPSDRPVLLWTYAPH